LPARSDGDPLNAPVRDALERPFTMRFDGKEYSLEETLAFLREATKSEKLVSGVPFYVDPVGLTEAEKTLTSPVVLDLQPGDVSIKTGLLLLLSQLDLDFAVTKGMVYITYKDHRDSLLTFHDPFQRVGHCVFALIAAAVGMGASRLVGRSDLRPTLEAAPV
jgi:hypothetical protein